MRMRASLKFRVRKDWWKDWFDPAFYTPATPRTFRAARRQVRFLARALGLERGAAVLDLCCGPGRHAVPLAKKGFRVTGLDYSASYLRAARRRARDAGVPLRVIRGDMKRVAFQGEFDAAICMFSSFGYFVSQSDNLSVLRGVRRALKPGGLFLLDVFSRDWLIGTSAQRHWERTGDGFLLDERKLLPGRRRLLLKWIRVFDGGKVVEKTSTLHLYDKGSLSRLLRKAGLRPVKFWGDFNGGRSGNGSQRIIALSRNA